MKNQGISLISLIITIIVIIILAAIVIFTGLGTPDSASFASFCQDCDNVYVDMIDKFAEVKVRHSLSGEYRTNEQLYAEVATGLTTITQYDGMNNMDDTVTAGSNTLQAGTKCQRIIPGSTLLDVKLPDVRENDCAWYVTEEGHVFNATGYIYDAKTYFNAGAFAGEELNVEKGQEYRNRANTIAQALVEGTDMPLTGLAAN